MNRRIKVFAGAMTGGDHLSIRAYAAGDTYVEPHNWRTKIMNNLASLAILFPRYSKY